MDPFDEQDLAARFAAIVLRHDREVWIERNFYELLRLASKNVDIRGPLEQLKPGDLINFGLQAGQVLAALRILDDNGDHEVTLEDVFKAFEEAIPPLSTGNPA